MAQITRQLNDNHHRGTEWTKSNPIKQEYNKNKQFKNKSILEYYFKFGSLPQGYDILNSREKEKTNRTHYEDSDKEYVELEVPIPGQSVKFKERIERIKDITKVNIIEWFTEFENIKELNNWTEENVKLILKNLIKDREINPEVFKKDFEEIKEEIIRFKYPKEVRMLIIKKLDKIYQTNFSKISEYLQELETTLKIYATITKIPKTEVARKLNELFIKNLGRATKLHLIQNEKDENYDTVYKYLLKLEKRLMNLALEEEISKISITTLNVENSKKYRTKFKNIKTERSKTNNLKSDKHKKESRSVFSKGEEEFTKKHTKEKYNAIIQEPVNKVDAIYCFFKFKNDKIKILIDSGSTRNIISKEFVKNYKLKEKEDEEISLTLGNSDTMKLNKTVTLGLTPTNSDKIFKIKFFVANKTPEALVFGNDFHTAFDSIINYKNWTLEAGGIIMEIHRDGTKNIDNNEVDKMFFDKFNTALERKKNNKNSDKQIRKYKQKHKHIEGNENVMADKISRSLTMKKSVKDKSKKYLQNLNKKHRTKINCINGKSFLPMKQSNKYKTPKTLSKDKGIEYDKKIVKVRTERQEVKQFF